MKELDDTIRAARRSHKPSKREHIERKKSDDTGRRVHNDDKGVSNRPAGAHGEIDADEIRRADGPPHPAIQSTEAYRAQLDQHRNWKCVQVPLPRRRRHREPDEQQISSPIGSSDQYEIDKSHEERSVEFNDTATTEKRMGTEH